ncbi:hypothetical protein H4F99_07945 [Lysobacter sp. SG-8]|uniref:Uncharacterized protein n=1 Tax=Marilutibacter penaei TaxID=2759900 RepID=A0A7W3U4G0_9GAMM|nr:hypothetical protein [Lysobacter penaei]MBB1088420.1 hypothetical protein [Lysobacter penaei]
MNEGHRRYSMMRGGLVYRVLDGLGLAHGRRAVSLGIALLVVALALVPLVVASALNGTLVGDRVEMNLLGDYGVLGRFLLAVPLLVVFAPRADAVARRDIRQLISLDIVRRGQRGRLQQALGAMRRARDSMLPEIVCLVLAFSPSLLLSRSNAALDTASSWRFLDGDPTWALFWFDHVSVPLFRFIALIWLWRFVLWSVLLWRLSRLDLVLRPAHPDGAGGLGFLGDTQSRCFAVVALVGGIVLCGEAMNLMLHLDASLLELRYLLGGYVVIATLVLLAPLMLLWPAMVRARRAAMRAYDQLAQRSARTFDRRWRTLSPVGDTTLLDDDDASGMADYGAVHQTASGMSAVPLSRSHLLRMAGVAVLPLLPLVFIEIPILELLKRIVSTLA